MSDVIIEKVNETFIKLTTSPSIEKHIYETFSFTTPKMKYHPRVKARLWDGYLHLFNYKTKTMPLGILGDLVLFFNKFGYTYDITFTKVDNYDEATLNASKKLFDKNLKLMDHQNDAIDFCLKNNRGIVLSATSSGKSAIIYILVMYYLLLGKENILIVVPRTSLCEQLKKDFIDYHEGDKESFADEIGLLYTNSKKTDGSIKISTWQSLQNKTPDYFENIDVLIVDEAHSGKAKELSAIVESCINTPHKFGFTGTLTNENEREVSEMTLKGLFGRVKQFITSKELIDKGLGAKTKINCVKLSYTDKNTCDYIMKGTESIKKIKDYTLKRKKLYENEIEHIINSKIRNAFISNFVLNLKGNTIVMFHYKTHGDTLYEIISEKAKDKQVFLIYGDVDTKKREEIREITEANDNVIIIASFGTTSTGINIRRLHNMVLAGGFKTEITTIQTIGRMLRKHHDKKQANIYDLGDDFSNGKTSKNFVYNHFLTRVNTYKEQQFDIEPMEYQIGTTKVEKVR